MENKPNPENPMFSPVAAFAAQLATQKDGGSQPRFSDLRFRRLLQAQDNEELFLHLIRAIRMLDGNVNLKSLAESMVYWWTAPQDRIRKDWAFAYYAQAPKKEKTA